MCILHITDWVSWFFKESTNWDLTSLVPESTNWDLTSLGPLEKWQPGDHQFIFIKD